MIGVKPFNLLKLRVPYVDLRVFLSSRPAKSNLPRINRYLIPGMSFTRPPRTKTVENFRILCVMPGIWQLTAILVDKITLATGRNAEFGFLGVVLKTFRQVPFFCGQDFKSLLLY